MPWSPKDSSARPSGRYRASPNAGRSELLPTVTPSVMRPSGATTTSATDGTGPAGSNAVVTVPLTPNEGSTSPGFAGAAATAGEAAMSSATASAP